MGFYKFGKCDYCGEDMKIVRDTPFMADITAKICNHCWNETTKEYAACNDEYLPEFDSQKEEYQKIINTLENGIKVYQIFLEDMNGWISKDTEGFRAELKATNEDYFQDEPENHVNVDFVMKCLELLQPGDEFSCKEVKFKCFKMDEETFKNLPEFNGW